MRSHRIIDERKAYEIWRESADSVMRSAIVIVLYILDQRRWHKADVIKFYEDFIRMITTPQNIFGKDVDDVHVESYLVKKYGFNFERVHINCASFEESKRRKGKCQIK